jgi:ADP-heptose:LPS heptosyltransferase
VAIELTRLGDAIVTVRPLLALERVLHPECLQIVVDDAFASFFRILFPLAVVHGIRSPDTLTHVLAASSAIRGRSPDLAVSWSPALRNGLMARLCGARVRAGYLGYRGSHTPFLERHVATNTADPARSSSYDRENIGRRAEKVLEVLGLRPEEFRLSRGPVAWSGREQNLQGPRTVVMHPFARWKYREWPDGRILQFVERVLAETECTIVLVGEINDSRRLEQLRPGGRGGGRVRVSTPADLAGLADVVAGSSVFVGTDSGPLHLASLLGVPSVGLFGPAPPELTAPLYEKGASVYHRLECSPCRQTRCVRPDAPCMNEITVEEVLDLVKRKLSGNPMQTTAA